MGCLVDMLTTSGNPKQRELGRDTAGAEKKKLTSQHELAIWQPAWPTEEQKSVSRWLQTGLSPPWTGRLGYRRGVHYVRVQLRCGRPVEVK